MTVRIPDELKPADGRFGAGPAKIRPEAIDYLSMRTDVLGTSHRQAPVKDVVATVQRSLAELYSIPDGYEVVLGNGGSTTFWDVATFSLISQRSAHGVFGEFTKKFATAAAQAPFLADPIITEAEPGKVALPSDADQDVLAWAHNETSTGACAPVRRIGKGLNLIDATSAAGGMDADIAQTDAYYFAGQKNFSADGGLWFAFLSPAAIERAHEVRDTKRYVPASLDLVQAINNSREHQTLNTPALATLLLLDDQLQWMLTNGGIDFAASRCLASSALIYDWADSHELATPFVAKDDRSPVVATIDFASTVDAASLAATLRQNGIVDVEPYRGLGRNQLRIATYASVDPSDVEALLSCIDYVLERITS